MTEIASKAFYNCSSLQTITVPNTIRSIGTFAFAQCKKLKTIYFNATNCADLITNNYAFQLAGRDTTGIVINIGNEVTRIPGNLFYSTTTTSYLPSVDSVRWVGTSTCIVIGDNAFRQTAIRTISIPASITSIGNNAFYACSAVNHILLYPIEPPTMPGTAITGVNSEAVVEVECPEVFDEYIAKTSMWQYYLNRIYRRETCEDKPTGIFAPNQETSQTTKILENGRLWIIVNGKKYDVLGASK